MKIQMNTRTASVTIVLLLIALGIVASLIWSDGSTTTSGKATITWHTFNEGIALAKTENKKVLIDVYTDWCVWCKKIDKEVYVDKRVGEIIAANYIAVKLNPEKSETVTVGNEQMSNSGFAQAMGVTGYPSTVILEKEGRPITKIDGFQEARGFSTVLLYIGEDHYKSKSFQEFKSSLQNDGSE